MKTIKIKTSQVVTAEQRQATLEAEVMETLRNERDKRLAASDVVALRFLEYGEAVPQQWLDYRQALRDLPSNPNQEWPNEP